MSIVFPSTLSYIVVGVAFAFTAIVMGLVGYYYRSREIGLVAALTGLISLAFLLAFYAEDQITTIMLVTGHSFDEVYRFLLLGATVFRGGDLLQAYWVPVAWAINTLSFTIPAIALVGAYLAGETLGLSPKKSLGLAIAMGLLGFVGAALSVYSTIVINPYNTLAPQAKIGQGLVLRDTGNVLKVATVIVTLGLLAVSFLKAYRDVKERPLLYNGISWLLLLIGFTMIGVASLAFWESMASTSLARGAVTALNAYYLLAVLFMLAGAVGVLFSSVAGYIAPAALGEIGGGVEEVEAVGEEGFGEETGVEGEESES